MRPFGSCTIVKLSQHDDRSLHGEIDLTPPGRRGNWLRTVPMYELELEQVQSLAVLVKYEAYLDLFYGSGRSCNARGRYHYFTITSMTCTLPFLPKISRLRCVLLVTKDGSLVP